MAQRSTMRLLDPKLDVVFKMLFAPEANERLLVSLLTAVLQPSSPILRARVLDPDLPKDLASDRGVRLDVLVELRDGRLVDVEMECDPRRALGRRWLYHWARLFAGRLRRGDDYRELEPVVCVVFLAAPTDSARFHSIYKVSEVHEHTALCDELRVDIVQLPQLERAAAEGESSALERWARFLRFDDVATLESLAQGDPIMAEAKSALEILSREPTAQRLAQMREEAEIERRLDRAEARAEGRAEGHAEGHAEGRLQTLRAAILAFCDVLGIGLSEAHSNAIKTADEQRLRRWFEHLHAHRAWPQDEE